MTTTTRPARRLLTAALALTTVGLTFLPVPDAHATGALDGVWQTDGYHVIVAMDNDSADFYDITSISCAASDSVPRDASGAFPGYTFRRVGAGVEMQVEGSVGVQHLRRLPALPRRCSTPAADDPLSVFDVFWATYAENYPAFAARGVDWKAERERVRPLIHAGMSDDELFDLLAGMLEPLGDAHTGVRSPTRQFSGTRAGTTLPDDELVARADELIAQDLGAAKLTSYAGGEVQYADLPGRVGYLRVSSFTGYTPGDEYAEDVAALDDALDAIFTSSRVARLRGLMIDVRVNGGGSDPLGLQIASRLTRKPYVAYYKRARTDAGFTTPQAIRVTPARGPAYGGPIAVLTAGSTVSAAETFTLALGNRTPRPIRFGEATQGAFSDTMIRTLPNGWLIAVPAEDYRSAGWQSYEGAGLPPQHGVPALADGDPAFHAAQGWLRKQ
jgi:hypothetical protein